MIINCTPHPVVIINGDEKNISEAVEGLSKLLGTKTKGEMLE